MKKYSFRLEQVRRVRQAEEDIAKARMAEANRIAQEAQDTVEDRIAIYAHAVTVPQGSGTGLEDFMRRRFFDDLAGRAVEVARESLALAEKAAQEEHTAWSERATKVKVLDRLDERNRAAYDIEVVREEIKEIDDLTTSRFRVKKWGDK